MNDWKLQQEILRLRNRAYYHTYAVSKLLAQGGGNPSVQKQIQKHQAERERLVTKAEQLEQRR